MQVWVPDVYQWGLRYQVAEEDMGTEGRLVRVDHTGAVTLSREVTSSSRCIMDLAFYPFDSQICHITFGAWSLGADSQVLRLTNTDIEPVYRYARSSGKSVFL